MDDDKKVEGEATAGEVQNAGKTVTAEPPKPEAKKEEGEAEPTAGEILNEGKPKESEERVVPEATFLEVKADNKKLRKDLNELKDKISEGAPKAEISSDLESIAKEYEIDPQFLGKLQSALTADVKRKAEEALAPIEAREKQKRIDEAFNGAFSKAIAKVPEFKEIANPEVIKVLSLDPKNAKKTFVQIIEEAYGSALSGKRTIETTSPGGGKEPQPLDYRKAKTDAAYFDEVMADPKLKAEYNERMLKEGF